jgi:hypothetical protein
LSDSGFFLAIAISFLKQRVSGQIEKCSSGYPREIIEGSEAGNKKTTKKGADLVSHEEAPPFQSA